MRGRFKGQPHVKLCAIRTRAEVDFSVVPFDDDPVADNQSKSRAGAVLGCEEWHRKDVGPGLWRDSTAIVRDLNEKKLAVAARADIFEFKMPCSCGRSGIAPSAQAVRELSGALEMNPRHHSKPWSCADPITME